MEKKGVCPVRRPRKGGHGGHVRGAGPAAGRQRRRRPCLLPPNVTMINNFFNKGPSEAETSEAGRHPPP